MILSGGHIRKISYGQSGKDSQITYLVDLKNGKVKDDGVIKILDDAEYFDLYNRRRFLVFRKKNNEAYIWKELLDIPVDIEYFSPKDEPDEYSKK